MEIEITIGLLVISLICISSSYYYNGNGQLGYKGLLFLKATSFKERSFAYKYSNRAFGALLFAGSLVFLLLLILGTKGILKTEQLKIMWLVYVGYIFCSMLAAELFVVYKKGTKG